MFGNKYAFDGLGVLFDSSPSLPLYRRTDRANQFRNPQTGWIEAAADAEPYVSAVLDDGTVKDQWLDQPGTNPNAKEAGYLSKTLGDCAAAFRNTNGLVWARIAHFNSKIYVHLDTSSHTTLSSATRRYSQHCFTVEGVKIPAGYKLGLTGLASANPSPDAVDIYAVETWEVVSKANQDEYNARLEHDTIDLVADGEHPLQGTGKGLDPAMLSLATDLFKSQEGMLAAIEALSLRVDKLSKSLGQLGSRDVGERLSAIDSHLSDLLTSPNSGDSGPRLAARSEGRSANPDIGQAQEQSIAYAVQQVHKVMSEMHSLQRQVEGFQNKISGSLNVLTSRTGEIFTLVHRTAESYSTDRNEIQKWMLASSGSYVKNAVYGAGGIVLLILGRIAFKMLRRGEWGEQRGKKLI